MESNYDQDFLGYHEPSDDEGMSSDEEDLIDMQMDGDNDPDVFPDNVEQFSQSTTDSQDTLGSEEPLSSPLYWKDAQTLDNGGPDPRTVRFKPNRRPGFQLGRLTRAAVQELRNPYDFFCLFLTMNLVTNFCIATNHNAENLIGRGLFTSYANPDGTWLAVTSDEMFRFIGIIIYMSFSKFPTIDRYWTRDTIYSFNPVLKLMSKRRFQALLAFLQVTPPADIDKNDVLTRANPIIDHVNKVSQELFQPYEGIAVDERIVASRHKYSGIRQYIKDKPVRFGLKLWVLADTLTGYTYNFFVYLGKKRTQAFDKTKGLAYSVTFTLIQPILDQGYRLFVDSFYTTKNLATDLLQHSTYLIGAVKKNSSAMPLEFKSSSDRWEKVAGRGDFRWHRENGFVSVQWKDCKVVTIISPIHKGSDLSTCTRTVKQRTGFKSSTIQQPLVIHDYNFGMLGVDKSNQFVSQYPCYIRSQFHWWKVLYFHCIDIMIVNSYVLFKEFQTDVASNFGQLEFRESLFHSFFDKYVKSEKRESPRCLPVWLEKRIDCSCCNAKAALSSLPLPSTKTYVYCSCCNVGLCFNKDRNCFKIWHSSDGEEIQAWHSRHSKKKKTSL